MLKYLTLLALFPLLLFGEPFTEPYHSEYVWSVGFGCDADISFHRLDKRSPKGYLKTASVKKGDTVWIQAKQVAKFYYQFLPRLKLPCVLIVTDGDEAFPSSFASKLDVEKLLNHKNIIHVFAQNCDYKGPSREKISPLPIGIDLHTLALKDYFLEKQHSPQEQEKVLKEVLATLKPTSERKRRALVDFYLNDTIRGGNRHKSLGEDRASIFERILPSGVIDPLGKAIPRRELWSKKGEYAFSIAPQGNGMDTHRLWEDLILGCIVITKTSPLDPLYADLPVVIVKDWDEITEANLNSWLEKYSDAFTNPKYREKLTRAYWKAKIKSYTVSR